MKILNLNNDLKLTAPDNWEIETDENIVSLFNTDNGVGALQFSFYQVGDIDSIDLKKELFEYLSDKYENITVTLVNSCAYSNVTSGNRHWKYWLLKKKKEVIFISYNCNENDRNLEGQIVDNIVKSISN